MTDSDTFAKKLLTINALAAKSDRRGLSELLGSDDEWRGQTLRAAAARALGRVGRLDAVAPLAGLLSDPDETVRVAAVRALGATGRHEAAPALAGALGSDPSSLVRQWAAHEVGVLATPDSVQALVRGLRDPDVGVQRAAADALADTGDPAALPELRLACAAARWPARRHLRKALKRLESDAPRREER